MRMYSSMVLLVVMQLGYIENMNQRCYSLRFSCEFNDPCNPLCVPGQTQYPGRSQHMWVECVGGGRCREHRCPTRTTWNQGNRRCQGGNRLEARCAFGKFSCSGRDPCSPALCETGVMKYPGLGPRRYVDCDAQGRCSDRVCPVRQQWDQDRQRCRRRNNIDGGGIDTGSGDMP